MTWQLIICPVAPINLLYIELSSVSFCFPVEVCYWVDLGSQESGRTDFLYI